MTNRTLGTALLANKSVKPAITAVADAFENVTGGALRLRENALALGIVIASTAVWTKASVGDTVIMSDAIGEVLVKIMAKSEAADGDSVRVVTANMRAAIMAGTVGVDVATLETLVADGQTMRKADPAAFKAWHKGDFVKAILVAAVKIGAVPTEKHVKAALGEAPTEAASTGSGSGRQASNGSGSGAGSNGGGSATGGAAAETGGSATDQAASGDAAPADAADMIAMSSDEMVSAFSKFVAHVSEGDAKGVLARMATLVDEKYPVGKGKADNVTDLKQPGIGGRKAG